VRTKEEGEEGRMEEKLRSKIGIKREGEEIQ